MSDTNTDKAREEEFFFLLTEGSEHLQGGRIDEARVHFERALTIFPTSEQALNLLGLALFRLGHLERARQIFSDLVHQNPVEPSLRLNLAMVFLKQGRLDDAHDELSHVLDLNPDHPRAASYMGLVLEKKGQLDRAADFYERAGNKKRADEIRTFAPTKTGTFPIPNLTAMGVQQLPSSGPPGPAAMRAAANGSVAPTQAASQAASQPASQPASPAAPAATTATPRTMPPVPIEPAPSATVSLVPRAAASPALAPGHAPTTPPTMPMTTPPTMPPTPSSAPASSASVPTSTVTAPSTSAEGAALRPVTELVLGSLAHRTLDGQRLVISDDGLLTFPIVDNGYVRSDLLLGLSGSFAVEVVHRRYRGKKTDSVFGGADAAIAGLSGKGFAVVALGELLATSVKLAQEELYLVEAGVVGFSSGLSWENGRLPSEIDRDLDIVHLRGTGHVVLATKRPLVAVVVTKEAPCMLHATRLLGWSGSLVPSRGPLPGLPDNVRRVPTVRFEGTGIVFTA
jgi:hypothetical protein